MGFSEVIASWLAKEGPGKPCGISVEIIEKYCDDTIQRNHINDLPENGRKL